MGMAEPLEDLDLAVEVFLELLVQAGELDRLDGDEGAGGLTRACQRSGLSTADGLTLRPGTERTL